MLFFLIITSNLSYPEIKQVRKIRSGALVFFFFFFYGGVFLARCCAVRCVVPATLTGHCAQCSRGGVGLESRGAQGGAAAGRTSLPREADLLGL